MAVLLLTGAGCLMIEPLRSTLDYGQVNAALMALVVADVLLFRRFRGVGVGVAAAIKLSPLFFVVLFIAGRDWPAVRRAISTFVALTGAIWLVDPRISTDYWLHRVFNMSRPGNPAFVGNQSILGALHRLPLPNDVVLALWALVSVLATVAVVLVARQALQRDARIVALVVVALGALLISPISWSHHWVWICLVPAMALAGSYRRLPWGRVARTVPWLLVTVGVLGPYWWGLHGPIGSLTDDGLVIGGLIVLVVWTIAVVTSRSEKFSHSPLELNAVAGALV
jgi:alpha-1,2-mannosyltransferase